jgi:hypothetical protein
MRRWFASALGLASLVAVIAASPAGAAPPFGVDLMRDQETVSHSDERLDYTVTVSNEEALGAPVGVGATLACVGTDNGTGEPRNWLPNESFGDAPDQFDFQWRRNGTLIAGADLPTYGLVAEDAGKVIQCVVKGTNENGAASFASLPTVVAEPPPPVAPPSSADPVAAGSRPTVTDEGGGSRTGLEKGVCDPPANWEGGPTYAFRWLRNGEPIGTAEAETGEYQPVAADEDTVLQCEVVGTNAGGGLAGISNISAVAVEIASNQFPSLSPAQTPEILANSPAGTVTLELELPGGAGTFALEVEGVGWSCDSAPAAGGVPAKVTCTRSGDQAFLAPQGSYPALTIAVALGADAPDVAVATATAFGGGAETASDQDVFEFAAAIPFGLTEFEARLRDAVGDDYTQAGGHPFDGMGRFVLAQRRSLVEREFSKNVPVEFVKQVITDIPRGVVGNARAVPQLCPTLKEVEESTCPPGSIVGGIDARFSDLAIEPVVYAIEPEFGTPAQFAFADPTDAIYTFSARLRAEDGYAVSLELSPAPVVELLEATAVLCNFGGKEDPVLENRFDGCWEKEEAGANPKPLFTNPTRCGPPPPVTRARANSWENPDHFAEAEPFVNAEITGCDIVPFESTMKLTPSSGRADAPTGLDVELTMAVEGLEDPSGIAQASLKRARIAFPEGMAVNPSAGQGLSACSGAQVGIDPGSGVPNGAPAVCPEASKVGTVEIETPVLDDTLTGDVYIAKQGEVGGALLGLYLVFESAENGIVVKMPARVDPDPVTGQLVATVDGSPQQPFSSVRLHFPGGPRATLLNPPRCGTYEISAGLSPWSAKDPDNPTPAETVTQTSSFEVTEGPGGGPCPTGALLPKLEAGVTDPVAGRTSPFVMRLSRDDGSQRFSGLNLTAPPGLTAYLKGIPYCPDAVLASISAAAGSGQAEIDQPSCPAASQVGTVVAGAGAGANPLYVDTGRAYLAGPYKGAPLSLAVVAPAVAGPLDLGSVVVRNALHLNPETAQVSVVSDPIPTILHGILLDVRDIRVAIDRPDFTLNPTSCEPMSVGAEVRGSEGASASLSNHFQVSDCDRLKFRPKLHTRLFGGTGRGAHPKLRAVLVAGESEANIARAAVTIPRSEFLDQGHIRTVCTRVQFAADACPRGSIYGHAKAFTPLLDYPVSGPVYLRSSDNELPDLVVNLHGPAHQPIEATVVGRIDSKRGQIRTTFESAPDVPLSKFVLTMQGGKKGLLVNSRNICARAFRATVAMKAHNGMRRRSRPVLRNRRCKADRRASRGQRRR